MRKYIENMVKTLLCATFFTLHSSFFISCTQDTYEKGEGKYSLMRADFVEAYSNGSLLIDRFTTDDGEQFSLDSPHDAKWVTTPDSTYRCRLYYKIEDGEKRKEERGAAAELVSIAPVPCPKAKPLSALDREMKTDPVRFESAWMSRSGRYLNLGLYLMTGVNDDTEASQSLGIVCDTIMPPPVRTAHLRLFHDQGGVPEYYSTRVYASIPLDSLREVADSLSISIQTYKGLVVKTFALTSADAPAR